MILPQNQIPHPMDNEEVRRKIKGEVIRGSGRCGVGSVFSLQSTSTPTSKLSS